MRRPRLMVRLVSSALFCRVLFLISAAAAQDVPGDPAAQASVIIWRSVAAAACITIAATAGAFAQSRAAQTALEGIARNPGASAKIFTPMLLGLALIESLVIYALIIAFILAI